MKRVDTNPASRPAASPMKIHFERRRMTPA